VVRADNPRQKLLPGMTATVRIITGTRRDVLRVPNEAVRFAPPPGMPTTEPAVRPNRDDAVVANLSEKLKMTADQVEKFRAGLAATRAERRERANGNGERARPDDETSTRVAARPFREPRGGRNGPA